MISSLLGRFAADEGPSIHVAPSELFHLGPLTITNSVLYGWIVSAIIITLLILVARKVTVRPKGGVMQLVEAGADFVTGLVEGAFTDKVKARKYVPFFVTIFFFILLNNWFGLMPWIGEAFRSGENPLLRPFTADLNGTLAIGIVTMGFVYAASIRAFGGFRKYMGHFFIGNPLNPLYLIIGLLEMLTDLTRAFSLALRLFLNVAIGEIVITVFSYLGNVVAPIAALPFTLMELFVGALQAYIFTTLAVMYLAIAVNHADEHDDAHEDAHDLTTKSTPETIKLPSGGTA